MRIVVRTVAVFLCAWGLVVAAEPKQPRAQKQLSENEKIDALIASVESEKGAVFIRNGVEYDAKSAAKHLRSKRRWASSKIKTAKEFIEKLGTGSSQSGKPYTIRLKNGKQMPSADFLNAELDRLEGKQAKGAPDERRPK